MATDETTRQVNKRAVAALEELNALTVRIRAARDDIRRRWIAETEGER